MNRGLLRDFGFGSSKDHLGCPRRSKPWPATHWHYLYSWLQVWALWHDPSPTRHGTEELPQIGVISSFPSFFQQSSTPCCCRRWCWYWSHRTSDRCQDIVVLWAVPLPFAAPANRKVYNRISLSGPSWVLCGYDRGFGSLSTFELAGKGYVIGRTWISWKLANPRADDLLRTDSGWVI